MSRVYIEICSEEITEFKGTSAKTGKDFHIRRQAAYLHQGEPYPTPFELSLAPDQAPYRPGKYVFAGRTFRVGEYGLEFAREFKLAPIGNPAETK